MIRNFNFKFVFGYLYNKLSDEKCTANTTVGREVYVLLRNVYHRYRRNMNNQNYY